MAGVSVFLRRAVLVAIGLTALGGCSAEAPRQQASADLSAPEPVNPPNIVLIVADSLSVMDTSLVAGGSVPTPNLEALARAGVNFTQGYAASSAAGPSRAGLITGTHPSRIGYEYDTGPGPRDEAERLGLPLTEATLGAALVKSKYVNGYFGRWGLGGMSVNYPTNRGYAEFYGSLGSAAAQAPPGTPEMIFVPSLQFPQVPALDKYSRTYVGVNSDPAETAGEYAATDVTDRAVEFIGRHVRDPFFVTLALSVPGGPLQVPARLHAKFPGIADPARRAFAGQVAAVDEAVGRIAAALTKARLTDNTLVIFTAVTGCNPESGACNCAGLRGGATTMYDGGTRVPLVMRWPQGLKKTLTFDRPVSLLDIFPTVLAATSTGRPAGKKFDGVDLLPFARGLKSGDPHEDLIWLRRPAVALRSENWKFIIDPLAKSTELFDLAKDPLEQTDLAGVRTDVVARLRTRVDIAATFAGNPLWRSRERATIAYCRKSTTIYR